MHPATKDLLRYFEYEQLPEHLQAVSKPFGQLARRMAKNLPESPQTTTCIWRLLEAKDCAVRAALPPKE